LAQLFFHKAVQNDTLFLSIVNVVDYSILVGFDENTHEIVVGIIDYMRQVRDLSACDSVRGVHRGRKESRGAGCDVIVKVICVIHILLGGVPPSAKIAVECRSPAACL
jgi:hypothetical protein